MRVTQFTHSRPGALFRERFVDELVGRPRAACSAQSSAEPCEELGQPCVLEEVPRIGAETLMRWLTLPPQAIAVLQEQRLKIAHGELDGLYRVYAEDRSHLLVANADELHWTIGVLIDLARRADAELDERIRLSAQPEPACRDGASKRNGSRERRSCHRRSGSPACA